MIISHRHRFVFFHQPLTRAGGLLDALQTWNEEPIAPIHRRTPEHPFYRHMAPSAVKQAFDSLGWDFASYRRITCTSDPFVRLSALYRRVVRHDPIWRGRAFFGLKNPDFDRWLTKIDAKSGGKNGTASQHWRKMAAWSCGSWAGDNLVTDIIPIENLKTTLPPVLGQIKVGVPENLDTLIPAPEPVLPMSAESVDLIKSRYAKDIETFGYQAPLPAK